MSPKCMHMHVLISIMACMSKNRKKKEQREKEREKFYPNEDNTLDACSQKQDHVSFQDKKWTYC